MVRTPPDIHPRRSPRISTSAAEAYLKSARPGLNRDNLTRTELACSVSRMDTWVTFMNEEFRSPVHITGGFF